MKKIHATIMDRGPLSPKEAAVLRYLCEGYLQKQIALKLFRSQSTVGKHIESIARKLDSHCAAEIVATSVALGLIKVEIRECTGTSVKVLLLLLMLNMMFIQTDGRRPPRPIRTVRVTQVVRTSNRYS